MTTPQEAVTAQTKFAEKDLTTENLDHLMGMISDSYADSDGFNKADMQQYFEDLFAGGAILNLNVMSRTFTVNANQIVVSEDKHVDYSYRKNDGTTTSGQETWFIIWGKGGEIWRVQSFEIAAGAQSMSKRN